MDIIEFQSEYTPSVIELIVNIQTTEYGLNITEEHQPDLLNIQQFYQHGSGNFWIACNESRVIGTISLLDIGNNNVALRKMFVHSAFRGKKHGVSAALLDKALNHAKSHAVGTIYLGTTTQFVAAHRFYEKNGFIETPQNALPSTFPVMEVDTKFYARSM